MYDQQPTHDVPQKNIVQRFLSQRWSAILLEIVMTIVITIAAGAAFDYFDPWDKAQADAADGALGEGLVEAGGVEARDPVSFIKEMGAHYVGEGRFVAAEAIFDWALALSPEDEGSYAWRGYANMRSGDYVGGQADYGKLVELAPASFDGHNALCWAFGETESYELALAHCERALNLAGSLAEYATALENRCWLQVEMGDYVAGARDCRGVLEAFSNCGEVCALAHYNLGRVLMAQGITREALPHFEEALRIGSSYPKMYLEIGEIYDTLGLGWAAEASFAKYRELMAGNAEPGESAVGLADG